MGLTLTTDEKGTVVYRKDKVSSAGNSYTTYSTRISSKDSSGEWQSAFIDIRFRKDVSVNNKAKIKIKNAFPTLNTYKDKTSITWQIMDFDVLEEGEKPAEPVTIEDAMSEGGFMDIPDGMEDTPFL